MFIPPINIFSNALLFFLLSMFTVKILYRKNYYKSRFYRGLVVFYKNFTLFVLLVRFILNVRVDFVGRFLDNNGWANLKFFGISKAQSTEMLLFNGLLYITFCVYNRLIGAGKHKKLTRQHSLLNKTLDLKWHIRAYNALIKTIKCLKYRYCSVIFNLMVFIMAIQFQNTIGILFILTLLITSVSLPPSKLNNIWIPFYAISCLLVIAQYTLNCLNPISLRSFEGKLAIWGILIDGNPKLHLFYAHYFMIIFYCLYFRNQSKITKYVKDKVSIQMILDEKFHLIERYPEYVTKYLSVLDAEIKLDSMSIEDKQ